MTLYVESKSKLKEQYTKICNIIDALLDASLNGLDNVNLKNYSLDDGQVKVMKGFTTPGELADAIEKYERQKQTILNKLNGRGMAFRDWRALR